MFKLSNSCDGKYNSVDIRFNKLCDNSCSFCIEKDGLESFGKTNVDALIKSTIDTGIKDVLILGGEPFIYVDNLLEYIKGIREQVDTIYITTSLPRTLNINNPKVLEILNLIDGLNVSVLSIDWYENNRLLEAKSKHNRIELLYQLLRIAPDKIRVSLNLIKGGIDSKEVLLDNLKFLNKIGTKHIKLNEMQNVSDLYVSYENMMSIKYLSAFSFGCQSEIEQYLDTKITLKRSCFMVEKSVKIRIIDLIKLLYKKYIHKYSNIFRVIYENGMIKDSWLKKQNIS